MDMTKFLQVEVDHLVTAMWSEFNGWPVPVTKAEKARRRLFRQAALKLEQLREERDLLRMKLGFAQEIVHEQASRDGGLV